MIKILFVCHGNICRSPMAEFILKDMAEKQGIADQLEIASAATSTESPSPANKGAIFSAMPVLLLYTRIFFSIVSSILSQSQMTVLLKTCHCYMPYSP